MTWNIERDADGLPVRLGKPAGKECPACGGTGQDPHSHGPTELACWTCSGTGRIARAAPITSVDDERVRGAS
jgi:DnaJ-class molecular chaperone